MRHLAFLIAGFALAASAPVFSDTLCSYEVHRPSSIAHVVRETLSSSGIALLGNRDVLTGFPSGSVYLLRSSQVLGTMHYVNDERAGSSQLALTDAEGKHYFEMHETTFPCPTESPIGRCKLTEVTTELDQLLMKPAPFGLMLDPHAVLHYYRYGKEVYPLDWQAQFEETIRWVQDVVTHPRLTRAILATDAPSRIYYALASNASIAPYVDRLTFFFDGTYWVVMGRVPSDGVYGLVIDTIRAAGFPYVKPEMTIDTGSALPLPLPPQWNAPACNGAL